MQTNNVAVDSSKTLDAIEYLREILSPESYARHRMAFDKLADDIRIEEKDEYFSKNPEVANG